MITSHRLLQSNLQLVRLARWGLVCLGLLVVIELCRELRRISAEYERAAPSRVIEPGFLASPGKDFSRRNH